jgi:hypothetical protein
MNSLMLSERQLKLAKWYLRNKRKIRLYFLIFFILLNVIFWGKGTYELITYFSLKEAHEKNLQELTDDTVQLNFLRLHEYFFPHDLIIQELNAIPLNYLGDQKTKYDLVVLLENVNIYRLGLIEYYFMWSNGETIPQETFILPGEKKYILSLGEVVEGDLKDLEFVISKMKWERIYPQNKKALILEEIEIEDIEFSHETSLERDRALPKISWQVNNQSAYSFWEVKFKVFLWQGNRLSGVNTISLKNLKGNEKRKVELLWPAIPNFSQITVSLEMNPFDSEIFIPAY